MLDTSQNMPATLDSYAFDMDSEPQQPTRVLKRKQVKAANLIGHSMSQREVAKLVGVSEWTMSHWMKIPEFQDAVMESARADIADIRATKNRSIRLAWEKVEAELMSDDHGKALDVAREVVRTTS